MAYCQCVSQPSLSSPPCDDCIYIQGTVVACADSTGPCDSGNLQLTTNAVTPTWSIYSSDDAFTNVAITSGGLLSWDVVQANVNVNEYYNIVVKVVDTDPTPNLGVYAEVQICIRDYCQGVTCPSGQVCDECDGNCVADMVDLEVT